MISGFTRLVALALLLSTISGQDPTVAVTASTQVSAPPSSEVESKHSEASEGTGSVEESEEELTTFKKNYATTLTYSGSARSYENIPNLLVVINGIATTYNSLFAPVESTNTGETDTMTSVINGLTMYATLRNFIIAFTVKFDQTQADLQFLIDNFGNIPFSKAEILTFYGLNDRYTGMKMNLNSTSVTFRGLDTTLTAQTTVFTSTQSNINTGLKGLKTAGSEIYSETDYLRKSMNSNAALDTLQKIDATLLLLPTLIMKKYTIDADIKIVKTNFDGLTSLRPQLVTTMDNMDLALKGQYSPPSTSPTGVGRMQAWVTLLLAVVALAF